MTTIGILVTVGAPISVELGVLLSYLYFLVWAEKDSLLGENIQKAEEHTVV